MTALFLGIIALGLWVALAVKMTGGDDDYGKW